MCTFSEQFLRALLVQILTVCVCEAAFIGYRDLLVTITVDILKVESWLVLFLKFFVNPPILNSRLNVTQCHTDKKTETSCNHSQYFSIYTYVLYRIQNNAFISHLRMQKMFYLPQEAESQNVFCIKRP